jgi:hypothetical protein
VTQVVESLLTQAGCCQDSMERSGDEDGVRRRVPVDAKYKLCDERKLDPADVYQVFFYAYAYAHKPEVDPDRTNAFIVYPASTGGGGGTRLRVKGHDGVAAARLRAVPFDVEAALAAIRERRTSTYPASEPLRAAAHHGLAAGGALVG